MSLLRFLPKRGVPRSILWKLLLPFSLVIGAIALFVFLYFPAAMEDREMAALLEKGRSIAAMAAFNAEAGVAFGDQQGAREAIAGTLEVAEVVRVDVRSFEAGHLARVSRVDEASAGSERNATSGVVTNLSVTEPVVFRGSSIGEVEVFLSQKNLREEVARTRVIVGLLSLLIFLSGVGILAILSGIVTRPLGGIVEAARAVSSGDMDRRAPVTTSDEVGVLAEAFNEMVSELQASQGELEGINRTLEERVAERTAALLESEQKLQQIRKMEAVGRLAGGVAHDFNNLLGVITGYVDLMVLEKEDAGEDPSGLKDVKKAADRAADLTRQLLAFGRRQVLKPQSVSPNEFVSDLVGMLDRVVGEHIHVDTRLDPNVGRFQADPGQLERALLNLAMNSRDAMSNGGTLTLETRGIDSVTANELWGVSLPEGRFSTILVRDDGEGIAQEDLPKVFEPFFSKNEFGDGSGLGLAMVDGIVNQSGGFLYIDSELGEGTEVRLCFPAGEVGSEKGSLDQAPSEREGLVGGNETLLVVEDEDLVRRMTSTLLSRAGYRVFTAAGGTEAIQVLETDGDSIDLVLTDVIMPGMKGNQLAERIKASFPDMGILFMSGHSGRALDEVSKSDVPLVEKPFNAERLTRAVRDILDGREAPTPA